MMHYKIPQQLKIAITVVVTLLIWAHIAWDYFNGGIPVHYILHDENMPGIPNWWGGIALPIFTCYVLAKIRKGKGENHKRLWKNVILRGVAGILFSVGISVFFLLGSPITEYMMLGLFACGFFIPLYKPEYLLGYVLGASFTFGAIIPIIAGPILLLILLILYKVPRWVFNKIKSVNHTSN